MQRRHGHRKEVPQREPRLTALALTAVAGAVDAIGYIFLAHIFVANMSGNSVALGLYSARLDWGQVWHRGFPIIMFVAGLLVGGTPAETATQNGSAHALTSVLILEALLLAGFSFFAIWKFGWHGAVMKSPAPPQSFKIQLLVALAALAMGVQNVGLRASGALSIYTTHVTGTLTQLADKVVEYGRWYWHRGETEKTSSRQRGWPHPSGAEILFLLSVWVIYVVGAAAGSAGLLHWGVVASLAPLIVLAGILILRVLAKVN